MGRGQNGSRTARVAKVTSRRAECPPAPPRRRRARVRARVPHSCDRSWVVMIERALFKNAIKCHLTVRVLYLNYVLHGFYFGVSYGFNVKPYHLLCNTIYKDKDKPQGRGRCEGKKAPGWSTCRVPRLLVAVDMLSSIVPSRPSILAFLLTTTFFRRRHPSQPGTPSSSPGAHLYHRAPLRPQCREDVLRAPPRHPISEFSSIRCSVERCH